MAMRPLYLVASGAVEDVGTVWCCLARLVEIRCSVPVTSSYHRAFFPAACVIERSSIESDAATHGDEGGIHYPVLSRSCNIAFRTPAPREPITESAQYSLSHLDLCLLIFIIAPMRSIWASWKDAPKSVHKPE
jgi:hypothetical protein